MHLPCRLVTSQVVTNYTVIPRYTALIWHILKHQHQALLAEPFPSGPVGKWPAGAGETLSLQLCSATTDKFVLTGRRETVIPARSGASRSLQSSSGSIRDSALAWQIWSSLWTLILPASSSGSRSSNTGAFPCARDKAKCHMS